MDARRLINTRMWSDPWFEGLDPLDKLIWVYVLTNPYNNILGIYEINERRISYETGIPIERVTEGLLKHSQSIKIGLLNASEGSNWVIIFNWLKNQSMNPNMEKAARRIFEKLPLSVKNSLHEAGIEDFESLSNASQILTEPLHNPLVMVGGNKKVEIGNRKEENRNGNAPESAPVSGEEKKSVRYSLEPLDESPPDEKPTATKQLKENDIPSLEEFLEYAESWMTENGKDFQGKKVHITTKYNTWVANKWKNGNNKSIKNWKLAFQNTEPYLKSDGKVNYTTRKTIREPQPGGSFGSL